MVNGTQTEFKDRFYKDGYRYLVYPCDSTGTCEIQTPDPVETSSWAAEFHDKRCHFEANSLPELKNLVSKEYQFGECDQPVVVVTNNIDITDANKGQIPVTITQPNLILAGAKTAENTRIKFSQRYNYGWKSQIPKRDENGHIEKDKNGNTVYQKMYTENLYINTRLNPFYRYRLKMFCYRGWPL